MCLFWKTNPAVGAGNTVYNNAFICHDSCPTPTQKISNPTPPPGFQIRDQKYSTYGDQALHSLAKRHQNQSHKTRYRLAARRLLANSGVAPSWQRASTALLSTIDTNMANIRKLAILDSGATNHFLQVDAPLLLKKVTGNPITVI